MSNIKAAIAQLSEPSKSIGELLIEFYETMKFLEGEPGKQATKIVMSINDFDDLVEVYK